MIDGGGNVSSDFCVITNVSFDDSEEVAEMTAMRRLLLVLLLGAAVAGACAIPVVASQGDGPPDQVVICHKPGTPAEKTMTLPRPAAENHIRSHGDTAGPCEGYIP